MARGGSTTTRTNAKLNGGGKISATSAGTLVQLIADAVLAAVSGARFHLEGFKIQNIGATAWSGGSGTVLYIKDSSNVLYATIAVSALTANCVVYPNSTGVTLNANYTDDVGATLAKGMKVIADANFGAGSDLVVDIWGRYEFN